jgi:MFS-type transporter involved in bile tolerance (Atg22 family)
VLVGAGDAMTFISVLRLVPAWFPARRTPLVTQLTGLIGQAGQILATFPLVAGLRGAGWTPTFSLAAAVGVLVALLVAVALRNAPPGVTMVAAPDGPGARRQALLASWREPGTRLGLWTHFVTQFSGAVFALFWGYPFLVEGEGLSPTAASGLLTVLVLAGMVIGPLLGGLAGRWPLRRSAMVLGIVGGSALAWTAVLAWPGRAPLPLLVVLVLVLAANGPGSMVGFDFARTENPPARLGSASGIVNVGGFLASLLTILAVGLVLDLSGSYRVAMSVQFVVWAVGLAGVLHTRRVLRRRNGVVLDPLPRAVARRLAATRG